MENQKKVLPIKPIGSRFYGVVTHGSPKPKSFYKKPIGGRFLFTKLFIGVVFATAMIAWLPVYASDDKENLNSISLKEAVNKTLLQHPDLPGYNELIKSADGYIQQAGVGQRPELSFMLEDAMGTGSYSNIRSTQSTLSLSWLLESELLDKRTIIAEREKSSLVIQQEVKRLDIASETARYYLSALFFQKKKELENDAVAELERVEKEVSRRVRAGAAPDADRYQAIANLEEKKLSLHNSSYEIDAAVKSLASQWGEYEPSFSEVEGVLDLPTKRINFEQLREYLTNHPNIEIFLSDERVAKSKAELAKSEAKTQWRFNAGIRRNEAANDYGLVAGFTIPLGRPDRNAAQIRALGAEQAAYRADAEATRIRMETDLANYVRSYERYQNSVTSLQEKVIPSLQRAADEAENAYKLGKYSFVQWSSVQQDLIQAQETLLNLQFQAHLNRVEIERLAGVAL